jgi:hypothetical protein
VRLSIIVECDNLRTADARRLPALFEQIAVQANELPESVERPLELIVTFGTSEVPDSMIENPALLQVRLIAAPGCRYYELKNRGAVAATGDVIVFADSDVIPEPDWLRQLIAPYADPRVNVVAGSSYIATDSLYSCAFALAWFFPLRESSEKLQETKAFFANNVALRRDVFLRHPFPPMDGCARGACILAARDLASEGISIRQSTGARVCHPAPFGARNFVNRAIAHGRDSVLLARSCGPAWAATGVGSLARVAKYVVRSLYRTVRYGSAVGLRVIDWPAAVAIACAYYGLFFFGELATHVRPRLMRTRFQL